MKRRLWIGALVLVGLAGVYVGLERRGYVMPVMAVPSVLCFDGCPEPEPLHEPPGAAVWLNQDVPLAEVLVGVLAGETVDRSQVSLLLEKGRYRLTVFYRGQPVKSYPMVLGSVPVGDKLREGDRKTPEGIFQIRDQYPHPSWSKFLWLSYPTPASWRQHWQAKFAGQLPWSATIGGEVGIHGTPTDAWITTRENWTLGCPSLRNEDIDELYGVTQVGTVVEILP